MEASSLRIGNLIKDCQDKKYYTVTIEILQEIVGGMDFYEPIQLNEKWLIKFGFVSSMFEDNVFIHYNGMKYFLETQQLHFLTIELNFKYVHILQNIYFALTGEELTIKE